MSNKLIADVFLEAARALETGSFLTKPKIGLTTFGSEHGQEMMIEAANLAKSDLFDVVLIGDPGESEFETVVVSDDKEGHKKMEEMLDSGQLDACVTMHYDFPIGVSTVGRVVTPARGKELILATTTGTSALNRVEAMVKNTVAGIAVAKSLNIKEPKVGILNIDGAKQTEQILKKMRDNSYPIAFAESMRADGGIAMRGNDLLQASCDVMVTDSLTGNLLMKLFSSYTTGGDYEATGFGYGPGVGEGYERKVFIISRASGAPVVANALKYAYDIVKGDLSKKAKEEYGFAQKSNMMDLIRQVTDKKSESKGEEVVAPPKEVVTGAIAGVDVLDLDDALKHLWKQGIYAESGMGCTGPIVMVKESNVDKAIELLKQGNFVAD